jgi:redox-sensitive bicupin YhaK (pirin superfamily)
MKDALPIRTQARVLGARVKAGDTIDYSLGEGRYGYLVPATGAVEIDGEKVDARDGVAFRGGDYRITALEDAELVLVDAR